MFQDKDKEVTIAVAGRVDSNWAKYLLQFNKKKLIPLSGIEKEKQNKKKNIKTFKENTPLLFQSFMCISPRSFLRPHVALRTFNEAGDPVVEGWQWLQVRI